jgi:transcriptional regulator with XRE-family HTH domain
MRDAQNLTLAALARRLNVTPPAVRSFEQAEAEDRITLGSLRRTAAAMGCDLIYALLPRIGTLASPADAVTPSRTGESVESPTPPLKTHDGDHPASKVTDKTWHALHGDS